MALWIALALLTAVVLLLLVLPLLRRPKGAVDQSPYDLAVYKDQLSEVDRDRERGLLTEDQAVAARLEIQRRILAAAPAPGRKAGRSQVGQPVSTTARVAALASVVIVPLGALGLYLTLGAPGYPDQPHAARIAARAGMETAQAQEMVTLTEQLAERLAQDPDNPEGWAMLGRSWSTLGRYEQAVKAFEQAVKRGVSDAATWAALGEALVAVNQGQVTAPAAAAFRNTLRKERDDPRARYYLGLARVQQGDAKGALAVWRDLEQSSPADAPWVPMIKDAIRQVATQAGIPPISVTAVHPLDLPDAPAAGSGDAGAEMRSQADAERAQSGGGFSDEERQMIQGMVGGLAERLKENPDDFAGWMRLGQSYVVLKQPGEAAEAYGNAVRLQPGNLEALRNLANAQALTAKEQGAEQPPAAFYETLRRILTVEPRDTAALKLVGEYEAAQGNAEAARELWTRLRDLLPEGSLERAEAERRLQSLGS